MDGVEEVVATLYPTVDGEVVGELATSASDTVALGTEAAVEPEMVIDENAGIVEDDDAEVGGTPVEGDEGVLLLLVVAMEYKSGRGRLRFGRLLLLLLLLEGDCRLAFLCCCWNSCC